MQKMEYLHLDEALVGNESRKDAEAIEQRIAKLSSEGWTIDSVIPLSYATPIGGSGLCLTRVVLLISK